LLGLELRPGVRVCLGLGLGLQARVKARGWEIQHTNHGPSTLGGRDYSETIYISKYGLTTASDCFPVQELIAVHEVTCKF